MVERLGSPAVTTVNGMGILPPGHPLSPGSTLSQRPVLEELAEADVVLAVGTELGETDTLMFDERLVLGGRLIRIDIDPGQLTSNALPDVAIISDAGLALDALERELGDYEADRAAVSLLTPKPSEESMAAWERRLTEGYRRARPGGACFWT
jgi:acetolactate synthase-1/2/3 large subunit